MKNWQPIVILASFICLTLSACAPFKPNSSHAGYCNQLNSQMIFGGSTTDVRQAEIQDAGEGLVQRTYDKKCG